MSHAGAHGAVQRVIVAIDDVTAASDAVDAAVQLASTLDARLTALFFENADLTRAAALPFLHETGAVSGTVQPMAGTAMLRTLRARAEQARSTVATAAEASGLAWQFEVVRGRRLALICASREALDLLVLAQAPGNVMADLFSAPFALESAVDARPVAVTVRDVPSVGRALHAAQALAAACHAPMLFLLCGRGADRKRRLREFANQALGEAPARAQYVTLPDWDTQAIGAAARQHHARFLVCCDGDLRRDAQRLDALLARVRCPLVVAD